jgi:hypothetical protein
MLFGEWHLGIVQNFSTSLAERRSWYSGKVDKTVKFKTNSGDKKAEQLAV